jgi:hypothetical protein
MKCYQATTKQADVEDLFSVIVTVIFRSLKLTVVIAHVYPIIPGLENRDYGRGDPLRWPRDTLYQLKLALTSPAGCGRSVGIVHLQTKTTELLYPIICSPFQPVYMSLTNTHENMVALYYMMSAYITLIHRVSHFTFIRQLHLWVLYKHGWIMPSVQTLWKESPARSRKSLIWLSLGPSFIDCTVQNRMLLLPYNEDISIKVLWNALTWREEQRVLLFLIYIYVGWATMLQAGRLQIHIPMR